MTAGTDRPSSNSARHRVIEGVLLRLSRRPEGGEFVIRGGLLMHHWFRPVPRLVDDLDLVATFPFDPNSAARRILPTLADEIGDGVAFDPERTRCEEIWLTTNNPGTRVFLTGSIGGVEEDFHVDVTFGPSPRPVPVPSALPTLCGDVIRMPMCRPEAVVGQKVQALWHRGQRAWRPKDLNDLRLLFALVPMDLDDLRDAIGAYCASLRRAPDDPGALFGPDSWWGMKASSARWQDFATATGGRNVPRDLARVVSEIADRLVPVLEKLP